MPHEISEDQLVHYFAGECSEKEAAEIETWIDADPARKQRVKKLRQIWEAAEWRSQARPDVDALWDNLARRLGPSELTDGEPESARDGGQRTRRKRKDRSPRKLPAFSTPSFRVSAVAISIVILTLAVLALYEGPLTDRESSSMQTIATEAGQRARIQLGDGTQVVLNAESELTMPPEFGDERRRVNLRGQAYFEVAPDEERPFLVHAEGSVTEVLGTRFDVGAYPSDETVRVVVAEGKVTVRSEDERLGDSVTLTERQMASLSKSDRSVLRQKVDPTPYLAWTKGQLVFRDASFEEVVRRLRSWYGLHVKLAGSATEVDHLNATFTDEPIGEVLSIIAETLDLRYEREGRTVTFFVRH